MISRLSPIVTLSRFDRIAISAIGFVLLLTAVVIMTADRIGAGPHVAYIHWQDDETPSQIYVTDLDGNSQKFTDAPGDVLDFAVAPDGTQIAFTVLGQNGASDLWLIDRDGRHQQNILTCSQAACGHPIWMPDGRRLLYERRHIPTPGAPPGNPRLWWLALATGETVPIFQDSQLLGFYARLSPDGNWLSFVSPLDQGIQLYNLQDGTGTLIPNQTGSVAVWSPAGDTLLLTDIQTVAEKWSVHLVALDISTRESTSLSLANDEGVDDSSPAWSPDGERIAFGRKIPRTPMGRQLWLMQADGSEAVALTNEVDAHHNEFAWSPDGRYIACQRYNLTELYAQPGVWLVEIDTGNMTEIAPLSIQPAWLP